MSVPKQATSATYYNELTTLQKSVPLTQTGYKNPVVPAYRRASTPGWLTGELTALPDYFPQNGRVVTDTTPYWYSGALAPSRQSLENAYDTMLADEEEEREAVRRQRPSKQILARAYDTMLAEEEDERDAIMRQ
jgi:hypothetical protein